MADKVIRNLDQVSTDWLTVVLANSGALTDGSVLAFDVEPGSVNFGRKSELKRRV